MKKSHRKDVIIARVFFALVCLLLIAGIAAVVIQLRDRFFQNHKDTPDTQTESQVQENINPVLPPVTENPGTQQPQEEFVQLLWTSTSVNLRTEPSTDSQVIMVLTEGARLELLGEEEGWVKVNFAGQEGYVSTDYVTDEEPQEQEENQ